MFLQNALINIISLKALEKQGKQDGVSNLEKVNLTEAMVEWTRQAGHPVVSVRVQGDRLKLRQNQFFLDSLSKPGKLRYVDISCKI